MEDSDGEDHRKQNNTEAAVDSLSALPVEVIYQIMEHLTLQDAAKMSALSRSWRKIWLSLPCIVFDPEFSWFLKGGVKRRSERSVYSIMHRILLLHEGPILRFTIHFFFADWDIAQWLSYISKSVRELTVWANFGASLSHVLFSCSKLRKLSLHRGTFRHGGTISIPPTFTGFSYLVTLELAGIEASGEDVFGSLIHTSSRLEKLVLCHCIGFGDIVIDFPLLRTLRISGTWKSISFKSAPNLKDADLSDLCVEGLGYEKALTQFIGSLIHTSSQLESLHLPDEGFKDIVLDSPLLRILLLSGSWQSICFKNAPNLTTVLLWGHYVEDLDYEKALNLMNFLASSCTIETLALGDTLCEDQSWEEGEIFESYHNCTLDHLRQIYVSGFKGLRAELKLMEFLLKSSPQLVKLQIVKHDDSEPEWKIPEELMMFPRASSEAEVIVVDEMDEFLLKRILPTLFDR